MKRLGYEEFVAQGGDLGAESAHASPIVAGLNAAARPNIELALRKRRRDLSSGSFMG
jgi:hypothetical protein